MHAAFIQCGVNASWKVTSMGIDSQRAKEPGTDCCIQKVKHGHMTDVDEGLAGR